MARDVGSERAREVALLDPLCLPGLLLSWVRGVEGLGEQCRAVRRGAEQFNLFSACTEE